jgi:hypothetical protein
MLLSYFFFVLYNINNDKNEKYYDFFFTKLKTEKERLKYLKNQKNSNVKENIKTLINLFIFFDYSDQSVNIFAEKNKISTKNLKKWHRSFHFSVLKEYWEGNETDYFKQLKNNESFQYLISLEDEKNFNDFFFEALKRK